MSTSAPDQPRATDLQFEGDVLIVTLDDGREVRVPIEWYPRLRDASTEQRLDWKWVGGGIGIHWPQLDEDLSVRGFLMPVAKLPVRRSA